MTKDCDHPESARIYETHGDEVMGVRCDRCNRHI